MSNCVPESRDRLRALAEHLAALPSVIDVDLITDDPTYGVLLDVALSAQASGIPPRMSQLVGEARATVVDISRQGDFSVVWVIP